MTDDMRSEHPSTLVCDGMATAMVRACHVIYIGRVMVGRHVKL